MLKISIDVATCMGHGRCYTLADELFDSDAAGRSVILLAEVPAKLRRQALLAAASCPERAISVTAEAKSRVYGDANPPLTYLVGGSGHANGDTLSGALATSATVSSDS